MLGCGFINCQRFYFGIDVGSVHRGNGEASFHLQSATNESTGIAMIEIDIHHFFVIYLLLGLIAVAILGWRERRRRINRYEFKFGDHLCACSRCRHLFVVRHQINAKCPYCDEMCRISRVNKRV